MAIPIMQGAQVGMALSNQMDVAQSNRANTRGTNINNEAKQLEIEEFILNSQRRKAERSLGTETAEASRRTLPSREAATIAQSEASTMEHEEFQAKKSVALRGLQQQVNTNIAERTVGNKSALDDTAKLTLDNNIAQLYVDGQETRTQLLGNAFSSVDDQESYEAVLKNLPSMGIDPLSLSLGPKYNKQNKAKVEAYREAAILTIKAERELGKIAAQMQPPAAKKLETETMMIPDGEGGFVKKEVFINTVAGAKSAYMNADKTPYTLPEGSYKATVGATEHDTGVKLKGAGAEDLAYIATTKAQLDFIDKNMFNEDGSVNRMNLFKATLQVPFVSGKGLPWDESRSLAANLGSVMAQALHIRSGKQSRVDEKADVYAQMMPNGIVDSDNTILIKYNVMKSLIHGTFNTYKDGPDGNRIFDLEATMALGAQAVQINQLRADAAANKKPEARSTQIPLNKPMYKGKPVPAGFGLTPGGNIYKLNTRGG